MCFFNCKHMIGVFGVTQWLGIMLVNMSQTRWLAFPVSISQFASTDAL